MKRTIKLISAVLLAIIISLPTIAQEEKEEYYLLLQGGNLKTEENINYFIDSVEIDDNEVVNGRYYRLVQFKNIPLKGDRKRMEDLGIKFLRYIPSKAYLASIPKDFDRSLFKTYGVRTVLELDRRVSLKANLANGDVPQWAKNKPGKIDIIANYHQDLLPEQVIGPVEEKGFEILQRRDYSKNLILRIGENELDTLVEMPYFYYIEPIDPPSEPENYTGVTLHRSNVIANFSNGLNYTGDGVKVMVQDDGIIGPHIDYQGRIGAQFLSNNNGDHGDHVAGIIMGAGNLEPETRGNGYGSDIYVYSAGGYQGFDSIYNHYNNPGIVITSTSYSNGCNAGYTTLASIMDDQVHDMPFLMHVFSAGNSGTSNCGYGAGNLWGNVTGGHKIGKNVIAVANLNSNDGLTTSSSRGPAHDGRIKPDISAKGTSVLSTTDVNDYVFKTGTSMSCPGVSGTLTQLYEAYKDLNGTFPEGGLIKALVMNTADDLGNAGPDFKFGWGRINARRAYDVMEAGQYLSGSADQGDNNTHNITVPAGVSQVRIMVYWTDIEASPGAGVALVNDLDMTVTDPGSQVLLPWVLDHTPDPALLDLPAVPGVDNLNNVEQVTIDNPTAGVHQVNVSGFSVPFGPQDYFVVYEFVTDDVVLTYPIGGEPLAPNEIEKIRWDAHGTSGTFDLHYSTNNGGSWNTIATGVNSSQRYFDWTVPSIVTGNALVRVTRGGSSDQSDATFSIIRIPQNIQVDWACPTTLQLSWNAVSGASGYEISWLGPKYMDSIGVSVGTSFIVNNVNPFDEYWFSVKALHSPTNAIGRRARAIYKGAGTFNCMLSSDVQTSSIVSPSETELFDCGQTPTHTVSTIIRNNGTTPSGAMTVNYRLNNGTIVAENYNTPIAPNSQVNYDFNTTLTLPAQTHNFLEVWTELPGDGNPYNDTTTTILSQPEDIAITPLFVEDFETMTNCSIDPTCEDVTCPLTNGWTNPANGVYDDIDWRVNSGPTFTNSSGPFIDHKPGTTTGNYLYLEASGNCFGQEAYLISPCIDLSNANQPKLVYWYHMFGNQMGSFHVDIMVGGVVTPDIAPAVFGDQGFEWHADTVDLSPYNGQEIRIRFRGITGFGVRSDMAIDDINILEPPVAGFAWEPKATGDVVFTDQSQYADSISMDLGDGTFIATSDTVYKYANEDAYIVTQIVTNACGSDTAVHLLDNLSIVSIGGDESISIYPNPNEGSFSLNIGDAMNGPVELSVVDLNGKVVFHKNAEDAQSLNGTLISLKNVAVGTYVLRISSEQKVYRTRLGVL